MKELQALGLNITPTGVVAASPAAPPTEETITKVAALTEALKEEVVLTEEGGMHETGQSAAEPVETEVEA